MNSALEYHVVNLLNADPGFPLREFKKKKKLSQPLILYRRVSKSIYRHNFFLKHIYTVGNFTKHVQNCTLPQ